ncbi:hypothetical protein [Acinetobacter sp. TUM15512]|uniref:hypothetical protein n=1 Tax=Acinetobacter sp. TUM15512 TaxID=2609155 RepID=UPI00125D8DEA|nr:hypothetical protein [Acinetobacter sp. TUM15512]
MMNKTELINFFTSHCPDIEGVDEEEIDNFLVQFNLKLRPEHRNYLIKYGNSTKLVKGWFADCTFNNFKEHIFDLEEYIGDEIPKEGGVYFGHDFSDESLSIESASGNIYIYYNGDPDLLMYDNVDSFIFHCLFMNIFSDKKIERNVNIKTKNMEDFISENKDYKIEGLGGYYYSYYLNANMLIVVDHKEGYYSIYRGGILDLLI